jgi:hypothetical protein
MGKADGPTSLGSEWVEFLLAIFTRVVFKDLKAGRLWGLFALCGLR